MKVSEILDSIGKETLYTYDFHWFTKNGVEVSVKTDYEECAYDIFGDKELCKAEALSFYKNGDKNTLQIYLADWNEIIDCEKNEKS